MAEGPADRPAPSGSGPRPVLAGRPVASPARPTPAPASGRSAPPDRTGQPSKPGTALVLRNEAVRQAVPPRPAGNELADFAKDLRELRTKAGLGYPEMAELSHYTMKTSAAAAGGLTMPPLPVTAAYVRAC